MDRSETVFISKMQDDEWQAIVGYDGIALLVATDAVDLMEQVVAWAETHGYRLWVEFGSQVG